MAFGGVLGSIEGSSAAWKSAYQPAAGVIATVMISLCNRAAATRTVRIAVPQTATVDPTPGDGDMLVYETPLSAAGDADDRDKLQITGVVLNGTTLDQVAFYASGVDVDCVVTGITES